MPKNIIEYESPEEVLKDLNARSHGKYYLCTCPSCQQAEAFMYKSNPTVIYCNRQNKCGETTRIHYTNQEQSAVFQEQSQQKKRTKRWLSSAEREELKVLTANMRYFTDQLGSFDHEKGREYRGLHRGTYQSHVIITPDDKFGTRLLQAFPGLMRRYGRTEQSQKRFENRDVVIPFYDEQGKVDRLLLRSTSPDVVYNKEYPKELHCVVQYQKEQTKNFQHTITSTEKSPILLTESVLNALSVKEVDPDVEFIAATGVNHTRQMKEYVEQQPAPFQERGVILAFDPDQAGQKEQEKWKTFFRTQQIPYKEFPYPDQKRDLNDLLQDHPEPFQKTWQQVTKQFQNGLQLRQGKEAQDKQNESMYYCRASKGLER
ncbi:toprim domain-containing protein [Listeria aquatica]|uniref:toprim domain-containing protein n=1 Tax=Listeria aquatica TaxID=1494960 RepID=UPI0031F55E6F